LKPSTAKKRERKGKRKRKRTAPAVKRRHSRDYGIVPADWYVETTREKIFDSKFAVVPIPL
jgi:hypothetical protein